MNNVAVPNNLRDSFSDQVMEQEKAAVLQEVIQDLQGKFPYAFAQFTSKNGLIISNNKVLNISDGGSIIPMNMEGTVLTVYDGEKIQEIYSNGFNPNQIRKDAKRFIPPSKTWNGDKSFAERSPLIGHFEGDGDNGPSSRSLEDKVTFVNSRYDVAKQAGITSANVIYKESSEFELFVDHNRTISQHIPMIAGVVFFRHSENSELRQTHISEAGFNFTSIDSITDKRLIEEVKLCQSLIKAGKITPGEYNVILTQLSGLLAHESFGHGMEGDWQARGMAKSLKYVGQRVGSNYVTIIDNPALNGQHGTYFFDATGELARLTVLVKNGIIQPTPLTDFFYGLNAARSANGRRQEPSHKIYPRQSNTYFEPIPKGQPGSMTFEEMLNAHSDIMVVRKGSGGMEDPHGWNMQVQATYAENFHNSRPTGDMFYDIGITGYLPDFLGKIEAVGSELEIKGGGFCGKGHKEFVRVSTPGPELLGSIYLG